LQRESPKKKPMGDEKVRGDQGGGNRKKMPAREKEQKSNAKTVQTKAVPLKTGSVLSRARGLTRHKMKCTKKKGG